MTSHKERVLMALNHEEPDRVPVDLGGRQTTLALEAYKNLKAHLGMPELPVEIMSMAFQSATVDERILRHFSIDCRHIRPVSKVAENTAKKGLTPEGDDLYIDQWGVIRKIVDDYANIVEYPLKDATIEDLDNYPWPDPAEDFDFSGVKEQAIKIHQENKYALVGFMGSIGNLFEQSWYMRELTKFLMDLVANKDFAHALLGKVLEIRKRNVELFLREVGEYLDVFQLADDIAMQNAPFMSPQLYREMIKPYQMELFQYVKKFTNAKIYYHSCGSIGMLLDDLIEAGVDILNPVQVSATNMETDKLKQRYGKRLSFWGAIDTFHVLPKGSPQDVAREVKKRIKDLAPGGGYVVGPVHNIQSDVPPENIIAMYETALKYGNYPL